MDDRSVLISGAGIVGPTLAFWLNGAGFAPTVVERAPALRTGGYVRRDAFYASHFHANQSTACGSVTK
jgi:2-polyprenyl-6-methoxyphenol hydroxylase-like FAD-dependent oxidoreductase